MTEGMGGRHLAAKSISRLTKAIAITVSGGEKLKYAEMVKLCMENF